MRTKGSLTDTERTVIEETEGGDKNNRKGDPGHKISKKISQ